MLWYLCLIFAGILYFYRCPKAIPGTILCNQLPNIDINARCVWLTDGVRVTKIAVKFGPSKDNVDGDTLSRYCKQFQSKQHITFIDKSLWKLILIDWTIREFVDMHKMVISNECKMYVYWGSVCICYDVKPLKPKFRSTMEMCDSVSTFQWTALF